MCIYVIYVGYIHIHIVLVDVKHSGPKIRATAARIAPAPLARRTGPFTLCCEGEPKSTAALWPEELLGNTGVCMTYAHVLGYKRGLLIVYYWGIYSVFVFFGWQKH